MTDDMKWQTPPPPRNKQGTGKWKRIAHELVANPGKWALIAEKKEKPSSYAFFLAQYVVDQAGKFESAIRTNPSGGHDTYMRWIPEEKV